MGLTRAQLLERSRKKLFDYLNTHGREISGSKLVNKIWDKEPICARDICVLSAIITKDGKMLFTDYDSTTDTYPDSFCRIGDELEREYLDSILEQMSRYDDKH